MESINVSVSEHFKYGDDPVVGTKIVGIGEFTVCIEKELRALGDTWVDHKNKIELPASLFYLIKSGVASREGLEDEDYFVKIYRGKRTEFALRRCAASFTEAQAVVYGIEEYLNDPDVRPAEHEALRTSDVTHVLVAVHAGPASLSEDRLYHNLAGGNRDFIPLTKWQGSDLVLAKDGNPAVSLKELVHDVEILHLSIDIAKDIDEWDRKWVVVADFD